LDAQRRETFKVTSQLKYKSEQLSIKVRRIKPEKVLFASIASVDCQLKDKGCAVIIHAVGPDCRSGEFKLIETESRLEQQGKITARKERLKNVYQNIFDEARSKGVKTIALPVLSVGVFKFPQDEAAEVVAEVLHENKHNFGKISLCYFEKDVAQPDILKKIISKLGELESLAVTVSSVVGHGTALGPATLPVFSAPSFASPGVFAFAARSEPLSTAFLDSKVVASQSQVSVSVIPVSPQNPVVRAQVLSRSAVPAPGLPRPISLASVSNPALPRQAVQSFIALQDQVSKSAIPAGPSRPAVSASVPAYKLPRLASPSVKPSTHVHSPSATIFPYAVTQESFHKGLVKSQYVGRSLSEEDKMREMRNEDAARIIKAARYIDNRLGLNNNPVDNEIKARLIEITYKAAIIAGGIGSRNRRGEIIPCARGRIVTAINGDFIGYQDRDDGSITNSDGEIVTLPDSVLRRIFENGLEYSNGLLSSKIDDLCFSKAAEKKIRQLIANHKMAGIFSSISRVTQEQTEVDNHLFRSAKNIRIAKRFTYFDPETVDAVCKNIAEKGVDARIEFPRRREARGQMFSDNKQLLSRPWGERIANREEFVGRSTE
jgi:O-acetyl-ADP-ribose deacetylase (regulator of RNase III)